MKHELKTWCQYFDAIWRGDKTFEVRKNDRNFQIGDTLWLREWDQTLSRYTGRVLDVKVTYIMQNQELGVSPPFVVMGFRILNYIPASAK